MLGAALLVLSMLQGPPADRPPRDTLRFYPAADLNLGRTLTYRYVRGGHTLHPFAGRAAPLRFVSPGGGHDIAWADSGWLYPAIRRLKGSGAADFVVVSAHGGQELADTADTALRRFFRGAIDAGADLCLGHHPHVLQPVEWYHGKPIAYSLGNF